MNMYPTPILANVSGSKMLLAIRLIVLVCVQKRELSSKSLIFGLKPISTNLHYCKMKG